jgi:hypothetical protein
MTAMNKQLLLLYPDAHSFASKIEELKCMWKSLKIQCHIIIITECKNIDVSLHLSEGKNDSFNLIHNNFDKGIRDVIRYTK